MFARAILTAVLAGGLAGLAGLAGCGPAKLDVNKNYSLDMMEAQEIGLPAQSQPQTITVEFESTEGAVQVGVYRETDADDILMVDPQKAIAAEKGQSGRLTASVPENTATKVVIGNAEKKTDVKVHVTNR